MPVLIVLADLADDEEGPLCNQGHTVWRHPTTIEHVEHEVFDVTCPYCGEVVEVYVEPDVSGQFVQDCEVCCNPWLVRVSSDDGERYVSVGRADGSD